MTAQWAVGHGFRHEASVTRRRRIANSCLAAKLVAVPSNPVVNTRAKKARAREVEDWNQYPGRGIAPDQTAEGKKAFVERLAFDRGVHCILNIYFAERGKLSERLGRMRIMESKRARKVETLHDTERAKAESAATVVDNVNNLPCHRPVKWRRAPMLTRRLLPGGFLSVWLVNLHFDAEVLAHHLLEMVAGLPENFQPAMLPIAYAGKPGRTSSTREALRAASLEMHFAIPIKHLAAPNFFN